MPFSSPALAAPPTPTPPEEIAEAIERIVPSTGCPSKTVSGLPVTARRSSPSPATSFMKKALRPTA